jgi:hypothetical protein
MSILMSFSIKLRHRSEPYLQIRTSAILIAGHGSSEVYISGWLHTMGISGLVNLYLIFSFTQNGQSCSLFGRITTGFRGCLVFSSVRECGQSKVSAASDIAQSIRPIFQ